MTKDITKWASPDYLKFVGAWDKIRDCYEGEDRIKSLGTRYLPQLSGQSNADYNNYLTRALFFPITGRTAESMVGLAMTKDPKISANALMQPFFDDDQIGYQWSEFLMTTFLEIILQGRYGVLVDAPEDGSPEPDICPYVAENIMKWTLDPKTGKCVSLILREIRETQDPDDRFSVQTKTVLRHCFIGADGNYWVEELDEDLEVTKPAIQPTFMGDAIDYIPFTAIGANGVHWQCDKPPMQDISTLNLSHYLTSADLEWGRHIVGLPTPVISGVDASTQLKIGGTAAWILPAAEAKAYYLEFQGLGLKTLETAMQDKVTLMASISARLADGSNGGEAAEAVRLRYLGESATISKIVTSVELGINQVFAMVAKMMRTDAPLVELNKDLIGPSMTVKDMAVLFEAYLGGALDKDTLVYNLRQMDLLDPETTDQEGAAKIKDPPPKPQPAANLGNKSPATA